MNRLRRLTMAICALGAAFCGCVRCPDTHVSIDHLVRDYNSNAAAVPRLWARVKMDITLADEKGRTFAWSSATPNGLLVLAKSANRLGPHDFVLIGREMGQELFRVGASLTEGVYYCWYRFGGKAVALWGRQELAGAPGIKALPMEPYQLLAVLGICELPADLTKLPTVAMAMSRNPCAYVLTYVDREPISNRITFRSQMYFRWSDTEPRRPFLINFFSPDGRRVMAARMENYKPVEIVDVKKPPPGPVVMPTDITIEICGRQKGPIRRIHMVLSKMTTADKWQRSAVRFGENLPPGIKKVQIDGHIGPRSAAE
ncbi:MAG: hypothetical protein ISS78_09285 [Phycisphaerae bacterium]|nr:hypothetical protein [Phycisphaerae bacterium]